MLCFLQELTYELPRFSQKLTVNFSASVAKGSCAVNDSSIEDSISYVRQIFK